MQFNKPILGPLLYENVDLKWAKDGYKISILIVLGNTITYVFKEKF